MVDHGAFSARQNHAGEVVIREPETESGFDQFQDIRGFLVQNAFHFHVHFRGTFVVLHDFGLKKRDQRILLGQIILFRFLLKRLNTFVFVIRRSIIENHRRIIRLKTFFQPQMFPDMFHCFLVCLFNEGFALRVGFIVHDQIRHTAGEAVHLHERHGDFGDAGK